MTEVQFGMLPKIQGSGRRSTGLWPGHAAEAALLREAARKESDPEKCWGLIGTGMKTHAASRVASLINRGAAEHFGSDDEGHFEAKTRRNKDDPEVYDLFARYVIQR